MKITFLLFILLFVFTALNAQTTFSKYIGNTGSDASHSIVTLADGGAVIAGATDSKLAGDLDVFVVRVTSEGDTLWQKTYGGPEEDFAKCVLTTSDNGFLVVGYTKSFGKGDYDGYVLKLNNDGDLLWSKAYGDTQSDYYYAAIADQADGFILVGSTDYSITDSDIFFTHINAEGSINWSKQIGNAGKEYGNAITKYYDPAYSDWYYTIAGTTDSEGAGASDIYVFQIDSTGTMYWQRTMGGVKDDYVNDIEYIKDYWGSHVFVIAGATLSFHASMEAYTIVLDENGDTISTHIWGNSGNELANALALNIENDEIYVTTAGTRYNGTNFDIVLNKSHLDPYNNACTILWSILYGGAGNDAALGISTSGSSIWFSGYTSSVGMGSEDAFIAKTNAQGYAEGINSIVLYTPVKPTDTEVYVASATKYNFGQETICTTTTTGLVLSNKEIREYIQPYVKAIGGSSSDQPYDLQTTNDGNLLIAGETSSFSHYGPFIMKADNELSLQWTSGIECGYDWADIHTAKESADGMILFSGSRNSEQTLMGKTDKFGNLLWSKAVGKTDYSLNGMKFIELSDKSLVYLNTFQNELGSNGLIVFKTNADGVTQWAKEIPVSNSYNDDENYTLEATPDGNFIVSSNVDLSESEIAVFIMKFKPDGDTLWSKVFWNNSYLYSSASTVTADGGFLLCSDSYEAQFPGQNLSIIKLDANGNVEYKKTLADDVDNYINDVSPTSDKGAIIASYNNDFPSLIKLDSTGAIEWSHSYFSTDLDAYQLTARQTADEGFAILGYAYEFGNGYQDIVITKTDKYGQGLYCVTKDFRLDTITDRTFEHNHSMAIAAIDLTTEELDYTSTPLSPAVFDYECHVVTDAPSKFQRTLGNSMYYLYANNFAPTDDGGLMMAYTMNNNKACVAKLKSDLKTVEWARTYNQSSAYADDVVHTSHGIYFLMDDASVGGSYVVKLNNQGDTIWTKSYNEEGWFFNIINTMDNQLVLVGTGSKDDIGGLGNSDVVFMKIKSSGEIIWSKTFGGEGIDKGISIQETSDGGFIIGGSTNSFSTDDSYDALIIKTDKDGVIEWSNTYGNDYAESCNSIIETVDKGYMFTGASNSFADDNQVYVVRLDHNGTELWSEVFFNDANGYEIIRTTDNNYLIGCTNANDITLLKINDFGSMVWAKSYGGLNTDELASLMQAQDGGYLVIGKTNSYATRYELYLIKTDKEGNTGDCHETNIANIEINPVYTNTSAQVLTVIDSTMLVSTPDMKNKNKATTLGARNVIMDISIDSTWVKCFNESNGGAELTIDGGIAPFTYLWSDADTTKSASLVDVKAGKYTVTVTDKYGCVVVKSTHIPEPIALTMDSTIKHVTCYNIQNGYIKVTPHGGTAPYRYAWNTGGVNEYVGNLSPNSYNVNVFDNKGCMISGQFAITQPEPISMTFLNTNITCGNTDGAITVNASGGTGALSYRWSTSATTSQITALDTGVYAVTVTDANKCQQSESTIVGIDTYAPELCLVTVGDSTNNNIVAWEAIKGSSVKEYKVFKKSHWNNNFDHIGTVAQGDTTEFADIYSNSQIHSDWYAISVVDNCNNESDMSMPHKTMHLTINKGLGTTINLLWERYEGLVFDHYYIMRGIEKNKMSIIDNLNSAITSWTDINVPNSETLYYNVAIVLKDTCHTFSKNNEKGPYAISRSNVEDAGVIDVFSSGIADASSLSNLISVTPNPVVDHATIRINRDELQLQQEGSMSIYLVNTVGQIIRQMDIPANISFATLDMSDLTSAVYYIKLRTANGDIVKKVIKL